MKIFLSTFFVVSFLFVSNGQENKITQELKDFTQIKAFDGISVNLIKSDVNQAIITGENTHKVAIVNNSGVLKIRMQIDKIFSGYRTFVSLYYTNSLKVIDVNEDAQIISNETIIENVLELKAQEGGTLEINCQTEQLLVKSITGGDIMTRGFSENQDILINTGGVYNGKDFKTSFTTVTVNAGGTADVYAKNYVNANVKAGGKVFVYGDPLKMDEKTVFGGKIERIDND